MIERAFFFFETSFVSKQICEGRSSGVTQLVKRKPASQWRATLGEKDFLEDVERSEV
jgi:hypothetical protein